MYKHTLLTLKNGLRLITVPMPQLDSVTVMVGVGAGARYETRKINGLSHFIEHMAFKGTKKRPSTLAIASEIEGVGGYFNAFTDKEFTGYFIKLAAKHQPLAFDILADMLTNSLLKTEEIEREKGVITQEINMRDDLPTTKVYVDFERLLYGDNPMGWDIAGEKETVAGITRGDFLTYLKNLYYAGNLVLGVAGNFKEIQTKKLTGNYFGDFNKSGHKLTKTIKPYQKKPRINLTTRKTEQAHFCLGVPGYDLFHSDRYVFTVLAAVLGVGMSSRLFLEIRERRGLAYYVNTDLNCHTDSGYLVNRAGVKLEKLEEAVKITLGQMANLASIKVKKIELERAKEMLKGSLILSQEDSQSVVYRYVSELVLEKRIITPQETLAAIDKVTADDVLRVAKDLFKPEKLNLAIVGPFKDETRFTKLLK